MTPGLASIRAIYRYPVKGLSPQALAHTRLSVGQTVPADRVYAIENGPSGFDPEAPSYLPKQRFLMLMRNDRLASLRTDFDEDSHTLIVRWEDREAARGDLRTKEGRLAIEAFFRRFMPKELNGPPKVLFGKDGHSFSDVARKVVSIINLASVAEVESAAGAPANPLRFRGNLYVADWPAWHEFNLVGHMLTIGETTRLRVVKRIQRCAATEVDPDTGIRDLPIPRTLVENFDHADCGVYAEVVTAGDIAIGDGVTTAE
ncbi:MAG TPA: MOSC domain-containing protein [Pseudolabrys sp.]|nr:MOSC domain-containing protein [Pseudolabrys sp.]